MMNIGCVFLSVRVPVVLFLIAFPISLSCAPIDVSMVRSDMEARRSRLTSMPIMMSFRMDRATSNTQASFKHELLCTGTRALHGVRYYQEKFRPSSRSELGFAEHVVAVNDGRQFRVFSERRASPLHEGYKRGKVYASYGKRLLHEMDPDGAFMISRKGERNDDTPTTDLVFRSGTRGMGQWTEEKISSEHGYMRTHLLKGSEAVVALHDTWGDPVPIGGIYLPSVMSRTIYGKDGAFVATTTTVTYRMLAAEDFEKLMSFELPPGTDTTKADIDIDVMESRR